VTTVAGSSHHGADLRMRSTGPGPPWGTAVSDAGDTRVTCVDKRCSS
jgi:hypothetical protein